MLVGDVGARALRSRPAASRTYALWFHPPVPTCAAGAQPLQLRCFDRDPITADEHMGDGSIDLHELMAAPGGKDFSAPLNTQAALRARE